MRIPVRSRADTQREVEGRESLDRGGGSGARRAGNAAHARTWFERDCAVPFRGYVDEAALTQGARRSLRSTRVDRRARYFHYSDHGTPGIFPPTLPA
jgi:hypothetical protein